MERMARNIRSKDLKYNRLCIGSGRRRRSAHDVMDEAVSVLQLPVMHSMLTVAST